MLVMVEGTDKILVMFWIPEGTLTFNIPKTKAKRL